MLKQWRDAIPEILEILDVSRAPIIWCVDVMKDDDGNWKFIEFNAACVGIGSSISKLAPLIIKEAIRQTKEHKRQYTINVAVENYRQRRKDLEAPDM